eukprot:TRINITY_DN6390_c0_g1_i1.p1 TRINITY_DN6390_c0_g1~~TRINITY_DN6390_c0_g1_i1.p1  ORF type:complete len:395 (+),score=165.31 TRINITY_DN6390_c0_g1_i1:65-1249(+)
MAAVTPIGACLVRRGLIPAGRGLFGCGSGSIPAAVYKEHGIAGHLELNGLAEPAQQAAAEEAGVKLVADRFAPPELSLERAQSLAAAVDSLPKPALLQCSTGRRASVAAALLLGRQLGWSAADVRPGAEELGLSCAGADSFLEFLERYFAVNDAAREDPNLVFRQMFDYAGSSSTNTYLLADKRTGEAVLIDPVLEQVQRDIDAAERSGVRLQYALNTHVHADHVTGTGALKERVPGLKSVISAVSKAAADVHVAAGDEIKFGAYRLKVLATPGHTAGCVTYLLQPEKGPALVFTGDALLIQGCGRTDFQEGCSDTLYDSVHREIFALPDSTLVYPAHEYKARLRSTVGEEKAGNPRLTKSKEEFAKIMADLKLPYPKKIDASLPANMRCGVQD